MSWEYYILGGSVLVLLGGGVLFAGVVLYSLFAKTSSRSLFGVTQADAPIFARAVEPVAQPVEPVAMSVQPPPPPSTADWSDIGDGVGRKAWREFMADTESALIARRKAQLKTDLLESIAPKSEPAAKV